MVRCLGLRAAKGPRVRSGILVLSIQVMCRCVRIQSEKCNNVYGTDWVVVSWEYTCLLGAGECGDECQTSDRE